MGGNPLEGFIFVPAGSSGRESDLMCRRIFTFYLAAIIVLNLSRHNSINAVNNML